MVASVPDAELENQSDELVLSVKHARGIWLFICLGGGGWLVDWVLVGWLVSFCLLFCLFGWLVFALFLLCCCHCLDCLLLLLLLLLFLFVCLFARLTKVAIFTITFFLLNRDIYLLLMTSQ